MSNITTRKMPTGYGMVQTDIMRMRDLSIPAKALYSLFASYTGSSSCCFPSIKTVMDDLGISEPSFYKYINELKDKGLVIVSKLYNDSRTNNKYEICYIDNSKDLGVDTQNCSSTTPKNFKGGHLKDLGTNINSINNINNINICESENQELSNSDELPCVSCDPLGYPVNQGEEIPEEKTSLIIKAKSETIPMTSYSKKQKDESSDDDIDPEEKTTKKTKSLKNKVTPPKEYFYEKIEYKEVVSIFFETYKKFCGQELEFIPKESCNLKRLISVFWKWQEKNKEQYLDYHLYFWDGFLEKIMENFAKKPYNGEYDKQQQQWFCSKTMPTPTALYSNINTFLPKLLEKLEVKNA